MKTNIKYILLACFIAFGFYSCDDSEKDSFNFSENVEILSFSIDGIKGEINEETATIRLMMPAGTDRTQLTPIIETSTGTTVTPKSGEAVNFNVTRDYIVEAKDIYQKYKVIVDVVKAEITKFTIGTSQGIIDQENKTILIYVPEGNDIARLVPVVEHTSDADLNPKNGSVVDFSKPVKYTLNYLGSVFEYTVTVIIGNEPAQPLVVYNGEDIRPEWWPVGSTGEVGNHWDNPKPNAINSTASCATIWRNPGDDPWTGGGLGGLDIDGSTYVKFSLMILKETAGEVQLEVQGNGAGNAYLKAYYSEDALGEWQKLEFVLPEGHRFSTIHTILVAPQIDDTKEDPNFFGNRMYWDQLIALPNDNTSF